ncbi:hypothetical protein CEP52_016899 [Fusarium oligoseptatum]|uniref:Uncharacterized protein n=1 Tax=Fusarium oligoseptatum TaxID=2604345 RepID=A0A428RYZ8_9HYPO|nr:hypothetical protein CEP52_016899 [Fusarium oligoseptatum]
MASRYEKPEILQPSRLSRQELPRKVTPPEHKALPSPPPTEQRAEPARNPSPAGRLPQSLLDYKRQAERGEVSQLTSISISQQEFSDAQDEIETAFRRFDYEPGRGRITLRMPSPTHDAFVCLIERAICDELARIGRDDDTASPFTSQILGAGSSRIFLDGYDDDKEEESERNERDGLPKQTRRQPDAQFQHRKAAFPGVVVEVSYSQDKKQLSKIAKQYIYHSDGDIKAVICIDINYGSSQSTISLWKPRFTPERESGTVIMDIEHVIQAQPFRTAGGQPLNHDDTLTLTLHDFAPDELCHDCPPTSLPIPFARICEFVGLAEQAQQARESETARGIRSTRQVKKRPLSSSSLEELCSEDETRFENQERAADTMTNNQDRDFEPRPAKRRA